MAHRIERLLQNANFAFKSPIPHSLYSRTAHFGSRFSGRISSFFKNLWASTITFFILFWLSISLALAADTLPPITPMGLPFESAGEATRPIVIIIRETIKYVGLFAILAVSWGWIQFLTSMGNDEKVKHAKQTVIYALVWVLLSVVAYTIIDIVNSLKIN